MRNQSMLGVWTAVLVGICAGAGAQEPKKEPKPVSGGVVSRDFPFLEVEHKVAGGEVILSANRFAEATRCDACRGDGFTIAEELKYPTRSKGPLVEPTKSRKKVKCEKCDATGFARGAEVQRLADEMVMKVVGLKPEDAKAAAAGEKLAEVFKSVMNGKVKSAAEVFNALARRRTNDQPPKVGTPILIVGHLLDEPQSGGGVGDGKLLRIGVYAGKFMLPGEMTAFASEASVRKAVKGDVVVVGGVFAGRHKWRMEETAPVIQGGFVVGVGDK